MGNVLQSEKQARVISHTKASPSREITRKKIMLMHSGRHIVAAKSGINYSLYYFTVWCSILKHRIPLSCPALHLFTVASTALH